MVNIWLIYGFMGFHSHGGIPKIIIFFVFFSWDFSILNQPFGGVHKWGYPKMDGLLFYGNSQLEMDDDWGYSH